MVLGLCIEHQLDSEEKAEKLRSLLDDVAEVTLSSEPDNRAYCWFKKSQSGLRDGSWIGGLEIYDNESALTDVHRSSSPYQHMRNVSAKEKLWGETYPELIFLTTLGSNGFLNNGIGATTRFKDSKAMLVVIHRHTFTPVGKHELYTKISEEADVLRHDKDVLSYCPLVRQDNKDLTVTVFQRYRSEDAYNRVRAELDILESSHVNPNWVTTTTTWSDGLGHIRGLDVQAAHGQKCDSRAVPGSDSQVPSRI